MRALGPWLALSLLCQSPQALGGHASFPFDGDSRLIRLSLDEGLASYGHLSPPRQQARRLRTTLD